MLIRSLKRIKKYIRPSNIINRLGLLIDYRIKSNQLLNSALKSSELITKPLKDGETELIVSLTTYSKRIHDVHLVIESIAQQTVQPNRLLLWLDESEFSLKTIPLILHKQIARGLEVRFCPDYKSYKKLIPTLKAFPEANIITIDDDILYPYDMVEILVKENKDFPNCVLAHKVHRISLDIKKQLLPYQQWQRDIDDSIAGKMIVPVGLGGVFYPVNSLNEECLKDDLFTSLAPYADDIWFKAMSLLNGVKCKKTSDIRTFSERFLILRNSQDIGLMNSNLFKNDNDYQIKNVFEHYKIHL